MQMVNNVEHCFIGSFMCRSTFASQSRAIVSNTNPTERQLIKINGIFFPLFFPYWSRWMAEEGGWGGRKGKKSQIYVAEKANTKATNQEINTVKTETNAMIIDVATVLW